ncbi:MAG: hypothetical protein R6U70_08535 [Bacillota bacterium]|jgi:hypothetical protein
MGVRDGRRFRPVNMFSFVLEFDDDKQMRECQRMLVEKYSFTGEMAVRLRDDGKWRLTAYSEKRFRESSLDRLPGRREDES